MPEQAPPRRRATWLTVTQAFNLNQACRPLVEAFGWHVYQVGSSLERRDFRDVDVRCILPDEDFDRLFPDGGLARDQGVRPVKALAMLSVAVSEWLANRTGLPIDFQFQRQTDANADFPRPRPRNSLGIVVREEPEDARRAKEQR